MSKEVKQPVNTKLSNLALDKFLTKLRVKALRFANINEKYVMLKRLAVILNT